MSKLTQYSGWNMTVRMASSASIYLGACLCFLLSGFAALLYQTAWMRQFSTVFGTSELAVATVLAAYMGGLALGAAIGGRLAGSVRRPIFVYGILEAAIALSALSVPFLLQLASLGYALLLGGQPEPPDASSLGQPLFYFVVAFLVLAMPTTCMGATLPLLTRYAVRMESQIGSRVGALYAINTAGAVFGALAVAFVLLPALGLYGTVYVGVGVNFLVFVLAAAISQAAQSSQVAERIEDDAITPEGPGENRDKMPSPAGRTWAWPLSGARLILPLMLFSGAASFVYEVLWTRLLAHVLGGSVAAFGTMLASFLSGIAIGSAIAARIARRPESSAKAFAAAQLLIALTSMLIYHWLHLALPSAETEVYSVLIALAILMPATLFIGATFPLAVRMCAGSAAQAPGGAARVYSWNTVGAIAGAALAGFFLIPALKYEGAIRVAVLTNLLLGLAAAVFLLRLRSYLTAFCAMALAATLVFYRPALPEEILRSSPITARAGGEIIFYEVGRSATVLMTREEGALALRNNGLPESGTELRGAPPARNVQQMLATLPLLIRPDAASMLIVGLGGGNTVNGAPPSVERIDVIELEPGVVRANEAIKDLRVSDPLADPRLKIYINDARSALNLTSRNYDVIVSQPSHPWTAGASHLYTREYMGLAARHLTQEGLFLQWMAAEFVDEALLRSLCATMLDAFAHLHVYHLFPGVLFFAGSQEPMKAEVELAAGARPVADDPVFYYRRGFVAAEDLLAGLVLDTEAAREFAAAAPLLTDNFNRMATASARVVENDEGLSLTGLATLLQPHVPLLDPDSWVHREVPNLNYSHISDRLEDLGLRPYAIELAALLEARGDWQSDLLTGLGLRKQGDQEEARQVLNFALQEAPPGDPSNQAGYALVQPWLNDLSRGRAGDDLARLAEALTGPAAAVIAGSRAAAQGDWQALASLDQYLAQSRSTDQWFLDATKLMVEWRNRLASLEREGRYAEEAWRIIDLAIAVHPVPDLFASRISAAYLADQPQQVLETSRRIVLVIEHELDLIEELEREFPAQVWDYRLRQIAVIRRAVEDVARRHPLDALAVNEVLESLDGLRERVESAMGASLPSQP